MRAVLGAFLFLVLLLLAAGGGTAWYALHLYDAPGPLAETRPVVIPRGGLEEAATALAAEGVVTDAFRFRVAALVTRSTVRAGELEFPAHASLRQVLSVLRNSRPVQHRITIPEGLTSAQVALLLDRAEGLSGATEIPAEGSILPATYQYERGTNRAQLLERMRTAMDRAVARAWSARLPDLPITTPGEAVILASIVERETARPEERPRVAAVYLNRLRLGMKLQSDPTVVYAASGGLGTLDHGLTRAELDRDDPYNTYRNAGLPPGPIALPGLASLRAVTQPVQTDELYFVADGSGGHVFAATEDDHRRNVARWREIERARTPGRAAVPAAAQVPPAPVPAAPAAIPSAPPVAPSASPAVPMPQAPGAR